MKLDNFTRRIFIVISVGILLPILGSLLSVSFFPDWRLDHKQLHSVIESLGGFIALALSGILLTVKQRTSDKEHHVWIACALISMGTLDIFHASVPLGNLFVWLHSVAQFLGGGFFVLIWLPRQISRSMPVKLFPKFLCFGTIAFGFFSIFFTELIPEMLDQGKFTPLARGLNIFGGIGFLIAACFFMVRNHTSNQWDDFLFSIHCSLFGTAGVLFELSQLWDAAWWWWHFLRLMAYTAGLVLAAKSYLDDENFLKTKLEELKQSNLDLENFALVASHDLKEPVRKIINFSELLISTNSEFDEKGRTYLDKIIKSSGRMEILINEILTYSRISGRSVKFESVNLMNVSDEAFNNLKTLIKESGGQVNVSQLPVIEANYFQMVQLFQNLISNSLKYRKNEGSIEIKIACSFIGSGLIEIVFQDNGIGFEEKYLEKIFQPFERIDDSGKIVGTGMGLAICQKTAISHGGTITARSQLGQGSTFIVILPEKH